MSIVDHHGEVEYPFSQKTVFDALIAAVPQMDGLELDSADEISGRVTLKAGMSLRSWGENIPIQLVKVSQARTRMQIMSTPKTGIMFGGAMDLGKNRQNIESIIKAVSDILATKEPESEQGEINITDELVKLKGLLDQGVLTHNEFEDQKNKLLSRSDKSINPATKTVNSSSSSTTEPVRIESKGNDNTMIIAIIAAIAFFIFMMLITM